MGFIPSSSLVAEPGLMIRRSAIIAAALVAGAIIAKCALSSTKYRRFTGADRCWAMPVYAGPAGPFIGYLAGGALIDPGTGPVRAVNITVVVNGAQRSVWRTEAEVRRWYVPVRLISAENCRWTPQDLLPQGTWKPSRLEYGLDVPLWHHWFGGWSTRRSVFSMDSI